MRMCFVLTFFGVISFIVLFVVVIVIIKDSPDDQMISNSRDLTITNIVITGLMFIVIADSSRRVTYNLAKVFSSLDVRQKATVKGTLIISLTFSAYIILIMIGSAIVLTEDCPLFTNPLIYVTMIQTFVGNLLIFFFHMVVIQHTVCAKCPGFLVTERPGIWGWLPFLPSLLLVAANCTLNYIEQFQIYINNNTYSVESVRLQACDDINSGRPYVCTAFASYTKGNFQVSDGIYITSSLLYVWFIVLVLIAFKRLSDLPYFEHRDLNISLRLYIWQTSLVYTCIYIDTVVTLAKEFTGCNGVLMGLLQTPELAVLITTWCFSRNYLYTPIIPALTKKEEFRMPQTHLQQFLWKGGETVIVKNDDFWTHMLSSPTFHHHGASVSQWKAHPVNFGPFTTLAEQPVFQFDVMLIAMFWAKLIYAKMPIDIFTDEVETTGMLGTLVGTIRTSISGEASLQEKKEAINEKKEKNQTELSEEDYVGWTYSVELAKSNLGLKSHRVFDNRKYGTRAIVAWSDTMILCSFRGSIEISNFISDLKITKVHNPSMPSRGATPFSRMWNKPKVHSGFLEVHKKAGVAAGVIELVKQIQESDTTKRQVLVTGHSYGASTAILAAYDISLACDLRPQDVIVYTFGCPAQGNAAAKAETEQRLPNLFNIINNSDIIYYSGKHFGLFKHPGIEVKINAAGDLIYRPTFVESSLSHFFFQDSILDHTFSSYQRSIAAIMKKHPIAASQVENIIKFCPTIAEYIDPDSRPFNTEDIPMSQNFKLNENYAGHGLCNFCGVQYESMQHISEEIKKDMEFGTVDLDGDGLLDKEEVKIAFKNAGMDFTEEEIDILFEKFDIDGSGKLDEGEYARLLKEKKRGRAAVTRKGKKKKVEVPPVAKEVNIV